MNTSRNATPNIHERLADSKAVLYSNTRFSFDFIC